MTNRSYGFTLCFYETYIASNNCIKIYLENLLSSFTAVYSLTTQNTGIPSHCNAKAKAAVLCTSSLNRN